MALVSGRSTEELFERLLALLKEACRTSRAPFAMSLEHVQNSLLGDYVGLTWRYAYQRATRLYIRGLDSRSLL